MRVWIMHGVNDGNEESGEYREVLAVFDHDPSEDEQEGIAAFNQVLDHFNSRFDNYEVEERQVLTKENQ